MWEDDLYNEELERLTYDYDSTIYYDRDPGSRYKSQYDSNSSYDEDFSDNYFN